MALSTSRTLITKTGISTAHVFDMGGINTVSYTHLTLPTKA